MGLTLRRLAFRHCFSRTSIAFLRVGEAVSMSLQQKLARCSRWFVILRCLRPSSSSSLVSRSVSMWQCQMMLSMC